MSIWLGWLMNIWFGGLSAAVTRSAVPVVAAVRPARVDLFPRAHAGHLDHRCLSVIAGILPAEPLPTPSPAVVLVARRTHLVTIPAVILPSLCCDYIISFPSPSSSCPTSHLTSHLISPITSHLITHNRLHHQAPLLSTSVGDRCAAVVQHVQHRIPSIRLYYEALRQLIDLLYSPARSQQLAQRACV